MVVSYSCRSSVTWESDKGGTGRGWAIGPFREDGHHRQLPHYTATPFWQHLDYLTDPALRRRVRRGLLKGEQLHALARHVHYGKRGHTEGRDWQQQMSRASCLVLILAAIIYW